MTSSKTENVVSNEANPSVVASALVSQSRKSNILSRMWNGIFRGGKEDFEKKLEYLSKEEAAVHARSKRRSQNWRKIARFLIIYSVILESADGTVEYLLGGWVDSAVISFQIDRPRLSQKREAIKAIEALGVKKITEEPHDLGRDDSIIVEKEESFIKELQEQLETCNARADAASITAEQSCARLEQKYISLSGQFTQIENEKTQLTASLDKWATELA
ncbi:hypothetical protein KI387_020861 [Taxus chinensis]|uniref:Uncharacterized protein n=1 Tax=Taxus chinensis TaxID=29808 RepID=A0AA38G9I6_TAXCH|nr:hypothetical protein KI387_020861 [Taxus chinensis]